MVEKPLRYEASLAGFHPGLYRHPKVACHSLRRTRGRNSTFLSLIDDPAAGLVSYTGTGRGPNATSSGNVRTGLRKSCLRNLAFGTRATQTSARIVSRQGTTEPPVKSPARPRAVIARLGTRSQAPSVCLSCLPGPPSAFNDRTSRSFNLSPKSAAVRCRSSHPKSPES
jgi:hypothetical protein